MGEKHDGARVDGSARRHEPRAVALMRALHVGVKRIDGLRIEPGSVAEYLQAKAEGRSVLLARRSDGSYEVTGRMRD